MSVHAVYAAVRQKPDKMKRRRILLAILDCRGKSGVLIKRAVLYRLVDHGYILVDHSSCAEIEMTHLAVAHLSFRKSHGSARSLYQSVRIFFRKPVNVRSTLQAYRIPVLFGTTAESVHNYNSVRFHISTLLYLSI